MHTSQTDDANPRGMRADIDGSFSAGELKQIIVGADLLVEINTDEDIDAELSILLINRGTPLSDSMFIL